MVDTSPMALRALVGWLELSKGRAVAIDTLRALADEKEELAQREARLIHRYDAQIAALDTAARDARRAALEAVSVERIETIPVGHPFEYHETPPIWRVVVGQQCADFAEELAARNFAAAIRALIDREPAPVVPDGWKLVPVEPTREMEEAHFDAHAKSETIFADVADVWRAMLAAAPTEPTP